MNDAIIGGLIALISAIVIGIFTPYINSRVQKKNIINKQILKLISILYLLKNNLNNYLNQQIYIESLGELEAGKIEIEKLEKLNKKIIDNTNYLYIAQNEIILNFKKKESLIPLIYAEIDTLEHFIWSQKMYYNTNKTIYNQESSDEYSIQLEKMMLEIFIPKIESIIKLNKKAFT